MNREILFRGKVKLPDNYRGHNLSHRNGDWVYGLMNSNESIRGIFVDTNTIGQYTGLTDKNGTKIFEGDIIQSYHHREPMGVAVIYWQGSSFWCDLLSGSQFNCCDTLDDWDCECSLEIIGNVFDNKDIVDAREWSSDGEWLGDKT